MTNHFCFICNNNIVLENNNGRDYDSTKHYLLCKICITSTNICSKSRCKDMYLLSDRDLHGTKYLFIKNPNNHNRYYLYIDIEKIIVKKYGNLDKLKKLLNKKENNIQILQQNKQQKINRRKNKLIKALQEHKLEFNNNGDSYMYINYGEPSINTIIEQEMQKNSNKMIRRLRLANALSRVNIKLDETLESVNNYINNTEYTYPPGTNINKVVKDIEMEYFLKHYTNYPILIKSMNKKMATELALKQYINNNTNNTNNNTNNINEINKLNDLNSLNHLPDSVSKKINELNEIKLSFD